MAANPWTLEDVGQTGGIDLLPGASAQDTVNFYNRYRPRQPQAPQPGVPVTGGTDTAAPPAAPVPPPPGQLGRTAPQPNEAPTLQTHFRNALTGMLTANQQPPSLTDPTLAPVVDASRAASQRGLDRNRAILAEQASAAGTNPEAGLRSLLAETSQNDQGFEAGLLRDESMRRRDDLLKYVSIAGQYLSDEDKLLIEQEIARLDAQIRQRGIDTQQTLGEGDLGVRSMLGRGDLGLRLLQTLLGERQANTAMGIDLGKWTSDQNRLNWLGLLGI